MIKALLEKADTILICGAMANTFLEAEGIHMGSSRVERDKLDLARELMELAKQKNVRLLLPIDLLGAEEITRLSDTAQRTNLARLQYPGGLAGGRYRPGHDRALQKRNRSRQDHFVEWASRHFRDPGVFRRDGGDRRSARESNATTIIGGGDSVTAVKQAGLADKMTFISTGGGASLELIEGKELPGVAALTEKN